MDIKHYVLTGGPGVGKSTTLDLLKQRGFDVVPETARAVHMAIKDAYTYFGYEFVSIPPLDPEERVRMILEYVR